MKYRLQIYKQTCYLFQYSTKVVTETEIILVIADVNLMTKKFQKHEYCHKNHTRVPSKSDYSASNTSMEDFTPGLNSAIDITGQGVILERLYVPVYYFLQAYGYDQKDKSCQRFLKSKLTEKYGNALLFVTVDQNRSIIVISLASVENQPVSNFVDKTNILKKLQQF